MINTLHDKIVDIANDKYWEISQRYSSSSSSSNNGSSNDLKQICEYLSMKSDYLCIKTDNYSIFKLGIIEVRRKRVIATIVGFLLYCLYVLVIFKARV